MSNFDVSLAEDPSVNSLVSFCAFKLVLGRQFILLLSWTPSTSGKVYAITPYLPKLHSFYSSTRWTF